MMAAPRLSEKLLKTPDLTVDRLPVLRSIFERFTVVCTEALREWCTAPTSFFLNQLEAGETWDILEAYEDSIGMVLYALEWDSRIVIGIDRRFVFSLLEALFGGSGTELPFENTRDFTVLETQIGKEVLSIATRALEESFAPVTKVIFEMDRLETMLEFSLLGQNNMPAIVAQILFQVMDNGGRMFVLIPQPALYPIRKVLERERASVVTSNDPRWTRQMQSGIARAEVILQAVLEGPDMTLGEVAALKRGQILQLDATMHSPLTLECENEPLFICRLGQFQGNFTVSLEGPAVQKTDFAADILTASLKR
jgi:flagellar motor switch protein FliM